METHSTIDNWINNYHALKQRVARYSPSCLDWMLMDALAERRGKEFTRYALTYPCPPDGNAVPAPGYLQTESGKTLIFSMMNNHFRSSNQDIRQQIDQTLRWLKANY